MISRVNWLHFRVAFGTEAEMIDSKKSARAKATALHVRYANKHTQGHNGNSSTYCILSNICKSDRIVKESVFSIKVNKLQLFHNLRNSHVEILYASMEARVFR